MDHVAKTAQHFTLEHVEWLVIDDADRLLQQSYQDWVVGLLAALTPPARSAAAAPLAAAGAAAPSPGLSLCNWVCCEQAADAMQARRSPSAPGPGSDYR